MLVAYLLSMVAFWLHTNLQGGVNRFARCAFSVRFAIMVGTNDRIVARHGQPETGWAATVTSSILKIRCPILADPSLNVAPSAADRAGANTTKEVLAISTSLPPVVLPLHRPKTSLSCPARWSLIRGWLSETIQRF